MNYELEKLEERSFACKKCVLYKTRTNLVWGDGDPSVAKILVLGEAPGEDEDLQGIPFIGKSGSLLRRCLNEAGWDRKDYFITNMLLCRPPNNRKPFLEEISACSDRLFRLIMNMERLQVIVCIGGVSANFILGAKSVSKILGWNNVKLIQNGIMYRVWVAYHPSYLLRNGQPEEMVLDWLKGFKDVKTCLR